MGIQHEGLYCSIRSRSSRLCRCRGRPLSLVRRIQWLRRMGRIHWIRWITIWCLWICRTLGYSAFPVGHSVVSKAVEVTPAKVEVKAITAPAVVGHQVVVAAPAAYTYHHAAPVAYAGLGYPYAAYHGLAAAPLAAAPAVAAAHVIAKRDAEADADPAYFYNGYAGYGGYFGGYAGLYAGAYAGYPYAGAYAGYPYAGAYAAAPSDPTAPHLVHTSRFGICTNYLGARVSC